MGEVVTVVQQDCILPLVIFVLAVGEAFLVNLAGAPGGIQWITLSFFLTTRLH